MNEELSFREAFLHATHSWPKFMVFCLAGALVGLIVAFFWPSPYRATQELYVGLNPYRASVDDNASAFAGVVFSSANDYKNWQMANLNAIIFMDEIISETLHRLGEKDSSWQSVNQIELRNMLSAYWRNAGKWRLVAESREPKRASLAVSTWEEVVLDRVNSAIKSSTDLIVVDNDLQALSGAQATKTYRLSELNQSRAVLQAWVATSLSKAGNQPPDLTERDKALAVISSANPDLSWLKFAGEAPPEEAPRTELIAWVGRVLPLIDQEIQSVEQQATSMDSNKKELINEYSNYSKNSLGLSPNLLVQNISDVDSQIAIIRPTGLLLLIGSLLGLIAWLIFFLVEISTRTRI